MTLLGGGNTAVGSTDVGFCGRKSRAKKTERRS